MATNTFSSMYDNAPLQQNLPLVWIHTMKKSPNSLWLNVKCLGKVRTKILAAAGCINCYITYSKWIHISYSHHNHGMAAIFSKWHILTDTRGWWKVGERCKFFFLLISVWNLCKKTLRMALLVQDKYNNTTTMPRYHHYSISWTLRHYLALHVHTSFDSITNTTFIPSMFHI